MASMWNIDTGLLLLQLAYFCFINCTVAEVTNATVGDETRLYHHLFDQTTYVPDIRPAKEGEQMNMTVKIGIIRIEDLDEERETLTTTFYFYQGWNDRRLTWNKTHYGGTDMLQVSQEKVWHPDVVLWNAAPDVQVTHHEKNVIIVYDGMIHFIPQYTLSSHCPLDVRDFPYDIQTYQMIFGSWLNTQDNLDIFFIDQTFKKSRESVILLTIEGTSMPVFDHPSWELVGNRATGKIRSVKYSCCEHPFAMIEITMKLQRKKTYYKFLSSAPSVLFGMLVPVTFLIPAKSSQKTTFGLLLIVAITLMLLIMENSIPYHNSSVPKIVIFYFSSLFLATMSVILSTLIVSISEKGQRRKPLPGWINSMFLGRRGLRRLLCIETNTPVDAFYSSLLERRLEDNSESEFDHETQSREMDATSKASAHYLREIAKATRVTAGKLVDTDAYVKVLQDWQDFARVLDRLFFVLFFILFLLSAFAFLG